MSVLRDALPALDAPAEATGPLPPGRAIEPMTEFRDSVRATLNAPVPGTVADIAAMLALRWPPAFGVKSGVSANAHDCLNIKFSSVVNVRIEYE